MSVLTPDFELEVVQAGDEAQQLLVQSVADPESVHPHHLVADLQHQQRTIISESMEFSF